MKTPEEIKKELERCTTYIGGLPYCECCLYGIDAEKVEPDCVDALLKDALAYIQQLENQIGELTEAEKEDRAMVLLKACLTLLNKQKESHYVLNLLEQTVVYDGTDCDGDCLSENIEDYLMEKGVLSLDEY